MIPPTRFPVWGIDPSTKRIALACVHGSSFRTWTLELGPGVVDAPKLAAARLSMVGWFESIAAEHDPGWLWIEEPFAGGKTRVHPAQQWMLGVCQEAAYAATGAVANLIQPTSWKKQAGLHGFARKRAILDWARGLGFDGDCAHCGPDGKCARGGPAHDAADALGVAVAGAVLVSGDLSPV